MRKNLVVVRAGDASLHPSWLKADGDTRTWDLHISYFGKRAEPYDLGTDGVTLSHEPGSKYHGLADCFTKHPQWLDQYEYIALPDDDLQAATGGWSDVFRVAKEAGAVLAQPSLDPSSFFSHPITIQRAKYIYRETDFVEVMCPVVRTDLLRELVDLFTVNTTSWGLDFLFVDRARKMGGKIVIVDEASLLHTRRIGAGTQYAPGGISPLQDKLDTLAKFNITEYHGRCLQAVPKPGHRPFWQPSTEIARARLTRKLVNFMKVNTILR